MLPEKVQHQDNGSDHSVASMTEPSDSCSDVSDGDAVKANRIISLPTREELKVTDFSTEKEKSGRAKELAKGAEGGVISINIQRGS